MNKIVLIFLSIFLLNTVVVAQSSDNKEQQELEKERQQLKRELDEKQSLLDKNKKSTKKSLSELAGINSKLELQERVINNLNRQVNMLDNSINKSQHDVRRLSLLLDTLKEEYSKSMVYSYKNRSNADFLNFIFSASSFNDAIKRVNYLKSYRSYREMQGENILRTQGLLKDRITELGDNKQKKDVVLQTQGKEVDVLATQQKEKNEIVTKLKAEGKELNLQIAAKKKQMQKVSNAIAAAIRKAQDDAKREAMAKARRDAELAKNESNISSAPTPAKTKTRTKTNEPAIVKQQSVLLASDADVKLNANFERNKNSLPWPVDRGYILMHFGLNELPNKVKVDNPGLTIGSDIGSPVKSIFDGEVSSVTNIEDMQVVILKHGRYFSTYSNLTGVRVSHGQMVHTGDVLGKVASNDEGVGSIDLIISTETSNLNPESWLRHK
jgi:septal ring factor EnvC (AmiA/AmiB activator)